MDPWLEDTLSKITLAQTEGDLIDVSKLICRYFGFDSVAHADIGQPHLIVPSHISTMAQSWDETYKAEQFSQIDGVLPIVRRTSLPFTWADVKKPMRRKGRKPGALTVFDAASDFGFADALVVPFHTRDRMGRPRSAVTLLPWCGDPGEFEKLYREYRHSIHILSIYLQQKLIDLVWSSECGEGLDIWDLNDRMLTDRERDVLAWAARGKTSYEMSEILSVSEETIETHFKHILQKLNCSNRTHAVAKVIRLGLIDI